MLFRASDKDNEISQNSVECEDFKLGLRLALNDIMRILKQVQLRILSLYGSLLWNVTLTTSWLGSKRNDAVVNQLFTNTQLIKWQIHNLKSDKYVNTNHTNTKKIGWAVKGMILLSTSHSQICNLTSAKYTHTQIHQYISYEYKYRS